jgi:hypothetical protein
MFFAYSALLSGLADDTIDDSVRTAAFAVGMAAVPFVFVVLAFGSRHPRAPTAVLKSLGVWIVIGVSIGWFSFGLGLVLAFGAGGMISLRADDPGAHRARTWALLIAVTYVIVLSVAVSPGIGLFAAGTVPLIALGFADQYAEHRRGV